MNQGRPSDLQYDALPTELKGSPPPPAGFEPATCARMTRMNRESITFLSSFACSVSAIEQARHQSWLPFGGQACSTVTQACILAVFRTPLTFATWSRTCLLGAQNRAVGGSHHCWSTPCGTRTRNLWIRGPTRYPLRQGGGNTQQEAAAAAAGDVELTGSRAAACVRSGWAPLCYLSLLGGQRWYRMGWLHRAPGLDGAVPMFCPSYSGVPTGG